VAPAFRTRPSKDRLQEAGKIEPPNVVTRQISREELAARGEDEPNPDDILSHAHPAKAVRITGAPE